MPTLSVPPATNSSLQPQKKRKAGDLPTAIAPLLSALGKVADISSVVPVEGSAGLLYVSDTLPGFTRHPRSTRDGKTIYSYRNLAGKPLTDTTEVARINQLAIPPAYTDVWICPLPNGHLQATGRDARGRKQYRYHADWQIQQGESKFERMQAFAQALPRIRRQVAQVLEAAPVTLQMPGKTRRKKPLVTRTLLLATLVRLLDTTYIRVGNDAYARSNGSYGLTTLRNPHAGVKGTVLHLQFRGKSGVEQRVRLDDRKVAAVVRHCQQLPGQELFLYQDEATGEPHTIGSGDVNAYLANIGKARKIAIAIVSGEDRFTAKSFRTWHATVQALELTRLALQRNQLAGETTTVKAVSNAVASEAYSAKSILQSVSRLLGNTPAVCRKSYIYPDVMALGARLALEPDTAAGHRIWRQLDECKKIVGLSAAECRLVAFLRLEQKSL